MAGQFGVYFVTSVNLEMSISLLIQNFYFRILLYSAFRQLILNLQVRKLTMQSNQICAICEKQPEDLLVLVCGHNLCVSCATEIYTLNGSANPFVCQICLMETQLDADTISHFQSETQRHLIKPEKKQKVQKPPKSKSPQKKMEQQKSFCRTHNQAALYYCFNCNTSQICSQCILTPKHSNHKVLTLKKAFNTLSKKLQEEIKSCQIIKSQLNQQKEFLMLKRGQCQHGYNSKKQEVKEIFDEIARMVSDKYASFCESIQQQSLKSMQIYEAYIQQINGKQKIIEDAIKFQKRAIASPSQSTLVEYMSNWTDHRQILTTNMPQSLPVCIIQIGNASSLCYQVSSVLNKFESGKSEQEQAIDYSVIAQQNRDEGAKAALKQSFRGVSNSSNIMSRSNNRVGSSRKLELSRSIQNATYIINKLQQRSKNS